MISMDWVPVQNPSVVSRLVGDEAVLVLPIKGQVKVLNELGARIWSLIDGVRTVDDIISVLVNEFMVNRAVASVDATDFLKKLADREIINFTKNNQA